jgi:hypothetical protein
MWSKVKFDADSHTYTVDGKVYPSVTEICSIITGLGDMSCNAIIQNAARRGTAVHELCALVDYGCDTDGIPCEPELVGYVLAYMRFIRDYKPEWEMIEQRLYSPDLGYAGTLDRFGTIDGKPVLLDIKTTASPKRDQRIAWACQLAAYAELLDTGETLKLVDLQIKKDGTYRLIDISETEKKFDFQALGLFLNLLKIYKLTKGDGKK